VLVGHPIIPIPKHPHIHHLGFVSDQDKFDALAAAELLVMPSYFESLSMVALEAWAMGKPVLANGQCDVLKGQCIRSNGGLYYGNFAEFVETLRAIDFNPTLAAALGRNGREYFQRHYTWPIIERKYLDMLERLKREPPTATLEPWPGWLARRRRTLRAANEILAQLPKGAVVAEAEGHGSSHSARKNVREPAEVPVAKPAAVPDARPARTDRPRQADRGPKLRGRQQRNRRPGGRAPRRPGNR
jgi:hypothetical protein